MQVFRLVDPGVVDRCIAFNSLPKRLLAGVRRGLIEGFPRHWQDFMGVSKTDKDARPFYFLEYKMLNSDKERWQQISNYVRAAADKTVHLLDKIEDMAIPLAPDAYSQLTLEPEDVPVIPIAPEDEEKVEVKEEKKAPIVKAIEESNNEPVFTKKKPGRPKKLVTA